MTSAQLKSYTAKWVDRLELGPPTWKEIIVEYGTAETLGPHYLAEIEWDIENSVAKITVAPAKIHRLAKVPVKETVIHELLHLRYQGHKRVEDSPDDPHFERAINVVANNLMKIK